MSTQQMDVKDLPTKLDRVERRARQDKRSVFNNLGHIIDLDMLRRCYLGLDGKKARGIDGISKEDYGKKLDENLKDLLGRIRRGSYHPKASRIVEIPKTDGTNRPLAISCIEDKIVQEAVKRILEKIYEPVFLDCSWGFRPGRNAHQSLAQLNNHLMELKDSGAVFDIDLRKYFNTIPHKQLVELLVERIEDERFMRLVIKLLKAPTETKEGLVERNEVGSPQGSILSPLLANVYLHYVLDEWFEDVVRPRIEGKGRMVRFADDVVFTFKDEETAKRVGTVIVKRLNKYGLSINEDKTRTIVCNARAAAQNATENKEMPSFTFLGFLHVWGKSRNRQTGKVFWRIKRRTCPKRLKKKLLEMCRYIKSNRHLENLVFKVKQIVQGYVRYFAISDNMKRIAQFRAEVIKMLFKWLNRRSQRKSYTWEEFHQVLERLKFPKAEILINIYLLSNALRGRPYGLSVRKPDAGNLHVRF